MYTVVYRSIVYVKSIENNNKHSSSSGILYLLTGSKFVNFKRESMASKTRIIYVKICVCLDHHAMIILP